MPAVAEAMLRPSRARDVDPATLDIPHRVAHAWDLWHTSRTNRAYVDLARVYHVAQVFLSYQPATELLWLAAGQGMTAAEEADDPVAVAMATWYWGFIHREANHLDAAETFAVEAIGLLNPRRWW
jgi:hypothetical protein